MRARASMLVPALALAALGATCEDKATGPGPLDGAWVLASIGGQPVPVLVAEQRGVHPGSGSAGTRREYVDVMRLAIVARGADTVFTVRRVTWDLDADGDPSPELSLSSFTTQVKGDTLCMRTGSFADMDGDPCRTGPILQRRGAQLVTQMSPGAYPNAARAEYMFEREP